MTCVDDLRAMGCRVESHKLTGKIQSSTCSTLHRPLAKAQRWQGVVALVPSVKSKTAETKC